MKPRQPLKSGDHKTHGFQAQVPNPAQATRKHLPGKDEREFRPVAEFCCSSTLVEMNIP